MSYSQSSEQVLHSALAFQRKWQRLAMVAYVTSTVCMLMASTGATFFAAGFAAAPADMPPGLQLFEAFLDFSELAFG